MMMMMRMWCLQSMLMQVPQHVKATEWLKLIMSKLAEKIWKIRSRVRSSKTDVCSPANGWQPTASLESPGTPKPKDDSLTRWQWNFPCSIELLEAFCLVIWVRILGTKSFRTLHPPNLKRGQFKRKVAFQPPFFGGHVSFRGCIFGSKINMSGLDFCSSSRSGMRN